MRQRNLRWTHGVQAALLTTTGLLAAGCVERVYEPAPPPPPPVRETVVEGPVVDGPGVEVIETEPAPAERVYVYDPGYPPGCYFYGGYYWYGGYRYPHDVFVNRYVVVNVRERRYINVTENRRLGARIEVQHRTEFARYHGARPGRAPGRPAPRPDRERDHR